MLIWVKQGNKLVTEYKVKNPVLVGYLTRVITITDDDGFVVEEFTKYAL